MKIQRIYNTNTDITLDSLIDSLVNEELNKFFNSNSNNLYTMITEIKNHHEKEEF